jgi:hypothetical protein
LIFEFQVAAKIIDQPEKAQWKNCVLSEEEETKLTDSFKSDFENFDFKAGKYLDY